MYRLQVFYKKRWIWGVVEYDSVESANARVRQLSEVNIRARVRPSSELFN